MVRYYFSVLATYMTSLVLLGVALRAVLVKNFEFFIRSQLL